MNQAVQRQTKGPLAPLPLKEGVAPSRVWLAEGPWLTVGQFLLERFQYLAQADLLSRLERGEIVTSDGTAVYESSPYQPKQWLWYYRDVPNEAPVPFPMPILFANEHVIAVDKPHFLASIPGGQYLRHTALTRLRQHFNDASIVPLHRLDRETAGVLLFCRQPALRGAYQSLFQNQQVDKVYEAIAPTNRTHAFPLCYQSRLQAIDGQFLVQQIAGEPNSTTHLSVLASWHDDNHGALSWYQLQPITGRKHQLRVHLTALGTSIINDSYYPTRRDKAAEDDFSAPLQLLARSIGFVDPISNEYVVFKSQQQLSLAPKQMAD